jgi:hypothetical protein
MADAGFAKRCKYRQFELLQRRRAVKKISVHACLDSAIHRELVFAQDSDRGVLRQQGKRRILPRIA